MISTRLPVVVALLSAMSSGCHTRSAPPLTDLIPALAAADRRAAGNVDDAIRVDRVGPAGADRPAILMRAPARVTWTLRFPPHAHLRSAVRLVPGASPGAAGVTVRIGLSDNRLYQALLTLPVPSDPSWHDVDVDLSKYSGWQWSLFYRPSEIDWRLIVNADAGLGGPGGIVAWAQPTVR